MLRGCGTNIGGSRGAARCVAARDNAVIAATLVARESAVGGDVARRKAAESAAGEAAQGHRVARRIAAAAAWAARKASVRCAAECYHAVAAASAARKVAAGCAAAGGDGEAVSTARDVADLCVAVLGDAANDADREAAAKHVVPHADAAALAAREAAAICDAAIADPAAGNDNDFLEKMRGWLMTVATLFVSMAFQAMVNPPGWMFDARRTVRTTDKGPANWPVPPDLLEAWWTEINDAYESPDPDLERTREEYHKKVHAHYLISEDGEASSRAPPPPSDTRRARPGVLKRKRGTNTLN
ncbi:hypothetical protein BRADI_2g18339v3 [Brachypodium distachyon]|uniref:PGG domain-containing protein n=1 Tax=Brachypodium distachyon TaxID=15368 RepID=A0A0Q3IXG2_BRADI|nr:hypothetical protein BRADI_2g18339v3 [Brachypodium distachyon]